MYQKRYKTSREYYSSPNTPHITTKSNIKSEKENINSKDPSVWGPACWFTLHNFAINYPINPSPICVRRCKEFIRALPYMFPCDSCSEHATKFIEDHEDQMNSIAGGRRGLFEFFVKFHNRVNERYGKKIISVEDAYKIYGDKNT